MLLLLFVCDAVTRDKLRALVKKANELRKQARNEVSRLKDFISATCGTSNDPTATQHTTQSIQHFYIECLQYVILSSLSSHE